MRLCSSADRSGTLPETEIESGCCGSKSKWCIGEMRLMQRLAISGLFSVILIVLLTGTFVTRRDLTSVVERGVAPEERAEQVNPAWIQDNAVPVGGGTGGGVGAAADGAGALTGGLAGGQGLPREENRIEDKQDRRMFTLVRTVHRPSVVSVAVAPPPAPLPGPYVVRPPNPPLDDVTHQRREKIKEVSNFLFGSISILGSKIFKI